MSKKKRPNQPAPVPEQQNPPVRMGNVFASFMREAQSIGNECEARRSVQADVNEFLQSKGLADEFEAWRKAKHTPPNAT